MAMCQYHRAMEKPPQNSESRDFDKYIARLPPGMRAQIADAAKANSRSMNAEIVDRLATSFSPDPTVPAIQALASRVASLEAHTLFQEVFLNELSKLGTAIVGRFSDPNKPSESEIAEWLSFFSQFAVAHDTESRRKEITNMFAALDKAKTEIRTLAFSRQPREEGRDASVAVTDAVLKPILDMLKVGRGSASSQPTDEHSDQNAASDEPATTQRPKPTQRVLRMPSTGK